MFDILALIQLLVMPYAAVGGVGGLLCNSCVIPRRVLATQMETTQQLGVSVSPSLQTSQDKSSHVRHHVSGTCTESSQVSRHKWNHIISPDVFNVSVSRGQGQPQSESTPLH